MSSPGVPGWGHCPLSTDVNPIESWSPTLLISQRYLQIPSLGVRVSTQEVQKLISVYPKL